MGERERNKEIKNGRFAITFESSFKRTSIWCTLLVHDNRSMVVSLYTIEEDVKTSEEPFCELCRCTAESGAEVGVKGSGIDLDTSLRYEGGSNTWMVRCECGARDDDGERMVACDICEVWQHTRCCRIEDAETVPPLFVCSACCVSLVPPRIEPCLRFDCFDAFSICCRLNKDWGWGWGTDAN